ncbi:MAG: flagellar biosynthesis protein FlhF [Treponema sp.]|nr:flagellar biosynthesis protein FlhF [Treponema sp.]
MEMYIEKGENRMDCELKIASKYNRPFKILSQKEIRVGGVLGFFSKPGVQVEFFFPQYKTREVNNLTSSMYGYNDLSNKKLEDEKKKFLAIASDVKQSAAHHSGKESSQQILDALKEIKQTVENNSKSFQGNAREHPAFVSVTQLLKENDFSENYINNMIERLRKEISFDQLGDIENIQEKLVEWIGESINIYKEDTSSLEHTPKKPRIMVLVGPTGVGKTTTVSKLAAIFGIGTEEFPAIDVKMITIDQFRIGAEEQLQRTGYIMRIPVSSVDNKQDLRKEIALLSDGTDLFLIDTIGKSPKDSAEIGKMKEILEGCGRNAEYHLVVSAATKTSDMLNIMQQFEPFSYKSIILSKMDETDRIGNLISALWEKRKSVSYITEGQKIPEDIRRATVVHFLKNLEGFKINREKIENRFPSGEADQFKWK